MVNETFCEKLLAALLVVHKHLLNQKDVYLYDPVGNDKHSLYRLFGVSSTTMCRYLRACKLVKERVEKHDDPHNNDEVADAEYVFETKKFKKLNSAIEVKSLGQNRPRFIVLGSSKSVMRLAEDVLNRDPPSIRRSLTKGFRKLLLAEPTAAQSDDTKTSASDYGSTKNDRQNTSDKNCDDAFCPCGATSNFPDPFSA